MKEEDAFVKGYKEHLMWREYRTKGQQLDIRGENIFDIEDRELEISLEEVLYGNTDFTNLKVGELSFYNDSISPRDIIIDNCEIGEIAFYKMNTASVVIKNSKVKQLRFYSSSIGNLSLDGTSIETLMIDVSNVTFDKGCSSLNGLFLTRSVMTIDREVDIYLPALKKFNGSHIIDRYNPYRLMNINSGYYNSMLYDGNENLYWKGEWYTADQLMAASRNGNFGNGDNNRQSSNLFLQLSIEMGMEVRKQVVSRELDEEEPVTRAEP